MAKRNKRAWLRSMLRSVRGVYREVAAMSLFVNLLALATPIFVLQVYDRVVFYAGLSTLKALVAGMALVLVFDFVLRQSRARLLQKAALRLDVAIGRRLFEKLMNLPLIVLEQRPSAFWQSLFRDMEVVRNTLSGSTALLLVDLPFAVFFVALVFVIAEPVAWIMLVILPLYVALGLASGHSLKTANRAERGAGFAREGLISEIVAGRATVRALAMDDWLRPKWEAKHGQTIERALERGGRSDSYVNLALLLTVSTTVAITAFGALAIVDQRLSIGALIATNILIGRIAGPFNQLVGSWRNYAQYRQAVARLGEMFELAEDAPSEVVALPRPKGEVTFDDVGFKYGEALSPAIDTLKAQIRPPGMLGVIGANGSGKTTLLKLMQGLYRPSSGRVLLDGADIAQFSRRQLAEWIGYVPQECVLFSGSIRDNLVVGRPEASDEEIVRAAELTGLHGRVVDLADGYGTEVGEAGGRLPGGLRQRIAITRAVLGDPPVVLLDEPSSNLDREGEADLVAALATLAKDRTIVVVTHSPGLLAACRIVLMLDHGRLARVGPPHEVVPEIVAKPAPPVRLSGGA